MDIESLVFEVVFGQDSVILGSVDWFNTLILMGIGIGALAGCIIYKLSR